MIKSGGRIYIFLAALSLLAGLIGCNKPADPQNVGEPSGSEEPVTLKFIWWGSDQRKEDTLKVIELYKKKHPHVNFETESLGGTDEVATQLAIETADQNTADIIQADYSFIFNYINRDLIEPLDTYIADHRLNVSDMDPAYLAPGQKDELLYALPMGNNAQSFFYNPAIFEKTGVAVPKEGYTIDDLHQTMVQLKTNMAEADFYPLGNMIDVNYYLRAEGLSMYKADGSGLGYEDDKILTDYFTLYKQWVDEGLLIKNSVGSSKNNKDHPIVAGKTALFSGSSNNNTVLTKLAGSPIKLLPFPKTPSGQEGGWIKPSMLMAVSSYSKHKEEAVAFMDFFLNDPEANDILHGERGVPASAAMADRVAGQDPAAKEQVEFINYMKAHSKPLDPPNPSSHVVINNAYQSALQKVLSGKLTPAEGAAEYRAQATEILNMTNKGAAGK